MVLSLLGRRRRNRLFPVRVVRAELRAVALLTVKVTWLGWLLEDFEVYTDYPFVRQYRCYHIACDSVKHELTKHIDVDASFVRASV